MLQATRAWDVADVELGEPDKESVRVRFTPAPGFRAFLKLERRGDAVFAPMYRAEVSTLVGLYRSETAGEAATAFLDAANATAFGGTWVLYDNGDVGLCGSLVFTDPTEPGLADLIAQLIALQTEDAVMVGRPAGATPFEDLRPPAFAERVRSPGTTVGSGRYRRPAAVAFGWARSRTVGARHRGGRVGHLPGRRDGRRPSPRV